MARREAFDKTALNLIMGTPFTSGEFYRVIPSTGIGEYVRIVNGQVVEFTKAPHDDEKADTKKPRRDPLKRVQNDMELRGVVSINGTPIEYYGTEKGWVKFKAEWDAA